MSIDSSVAMIHKSLVAAFLVWWVYIAEVIWIYVSLSVNGEK